MTILELVLISISLLLLFFIIRFWIITNNYIDDISILENNNENYENFFIGIKKEFRESLKILRSYDVEGLFEATDELGIFFKTIKKIYYNLDDYFKEESTNEIQNKQQ